MLILVCMYTYVSAYYERAFVIQTESKIICDYMHTLIFLVVYDSQTSSIHLQYTLSPMTVALCVTCVWHGTIVITTYIFKYAQDSEAK